MALWSDIVGVAKGYLILGSAGVRLKTASGKLSVRNTADSADAQITVASLATGTPDGTKFVRDDGTLATPPGGVPSNVFSATATVAADTSYIVASYLKVESDLTVSGNLMVTG